MSEQQLFEVVATAGVRWSAEAPRRYDKDSGPDRNACDWHRHKRERDRRSKADEDAQQK